MFIISFAIRAILVFAVITAIGQIRWNERSVENRYHNFVNSDEFQTWFWALSLPVTWGTEKLERGLNALSPDDIDEATEAAR